MSPRKSLEDILNQLERVRAAGKGFSARCPALGHEDKRNSLTISQADNGKINVTCHAGCGIDEILSPLGMTASDLYPNEVAKKSFDKRYPPPWKWEEKGLLEAIYTYSDEGGNYLFEVMRSKDKEFRQRVRDKRERSGYKYSLKGVRTVLYRLPDLLDAIDLGETVFVVEGEKDVETLEAIDVSATTAPRGANTWDNDFTKVLSNAHRVIIIPDNDTKGREHAWKIHGDLQNAVVLELPDLPHKGDATDWVKAGGTADDLWELVDDVSKNPPERPCTGEDASDGKAYKSKDWINLADDFLKQTFHDSSNRLLLRRYRDQFFSFNGSCYEPITEEALRANIRNFLHKQKIVRKGKRCPFNPSDKNVQEVLMALPARGCLLSGHLEVPAWIGDYTTPVNPALVVLKNGILNLRTRKIEPATPDYFVLNALPVKFDSSAGEPKQFHAFLDSIWGEDTQSKETLLEFFGYFLTQDTSQQKCLFILGPPRSGKGTIARILGALLGDGNIVAPTLSALGTQFGKQGLIGKQLAVIADARMSGRTDAVQTGEAILGITGEDTQSIPRKYMGDWVGKLKTRFLMMSNELTRFADSSGAMVSRFIVLAQKNTFYGKENLNLLPGILEELPGILNLSIDGYNRLIDRGHFLQPNSGMEILEEFRSLSSPILQFVDECCAVNPSATAHIDNLYQQYKKWCEVNGKTYPGTKQMFGRDLRAALPQLKDIRPRIGKGKRQRVYQGIGLQVL